MHKLLLIGAFAAFASADAQNRQPDFHWEKALPAGNHVRIHNISGNIEVVPSTSGKVEVSGFKTRNRSDDDLRAEVHEGRNGIDVCVLRGDDECDEHGLHSEGDHWGGRRYGDMDLRVAVPSNLEVAASSVSGDVGIDGAQGDIDAHSVSGSIDLRHLRASSVNAHSVSGEIAAQIDALTGNGDLEFHTVSGRVSLDVPKSFDADLRMRTVSGRLDSDFPITLTGGFGRHDIDAKIGNGGRRLDVSTVSGSLRIKTNRSEESR